MLCFDDVFGLSLYLFDNEIKCMFSKLTESSQISEGCLPLSVEMNRIDFTFSSTFEGGVHPPYTPIPRPGEGKESEY